MSAFTRSVTGGIDIQTASLFVLTESAELSSQLLERLPNTITTSAYSEDIGAVVRELDIDGDCAVLAIGDDDRAAITAMTQTEDKHPVFGRWIGMGQLPIDLKDELETAGTPVEFSTEGRFQHPNAEDRLRSPTNGRQTFHNGGQC